MRRSSFISNFSWALAAIAAFVALDYFLANSPAAGRFFLQYSDIAFDNPLRFHEKFLRSRHEAGKPLVVVIGSSIARESIDENIVAQLLGGKVQVLNLAFFHGRPVDFWMLFEDILALHPDLVVMPLIPGDEYLEYSYRITMPFYFRGRLFDLIGSREIFTHWREFFYAYLARCSFIFRYRDSIGASVLRFGRDRLGLETWHQRGTFRFVAETEVLPVLDERLSLFGQDFVPDNGLNLRATHRMLQELAAVKIPSVVVEMATHPKLEAELDRLRKIEFLGWEKREFLRELAGWASMPGVVSIRAPEGVISNRDYADYIHLNASGREKYSRWFAEWLMKSKLIPAGLQ